MLGARPTVSVVMVAKQAERVLPSAIRSIESQDYPGIKEVIVAASDEKTAVTATGLGARVIANDVGTTPVGLNLAIREATGDVIVRCDAQSSLPPDYVSLAIETMQRTGADLVGGMQVPRGTTVLERVIGAAMSSPFGSGDARYRIGGDEGPAETVYLGVFRRSLIEAMGGYDERFERSQDYELNHRILQGGGVVWFDPALKVGYKPRGSFFALARQYFDYGKWKRRMGRIHPGSLRWRQKIPPIATLILFLALALSPWIGQLLAIPLLYLAGVTLASIAIPSGLGAGKVMVPAALATMHMAWGLGFLLAFSGPSAGPDERGRPSDDRGRTEATPAAARVRSGVALVILAAGTGERLGFNMPKALVEVAGESLLERQIRLMSDLVDELHVVVGYRRDLVQSVVPFASFIENSDYASTNTSDSLRRALESIDPGRVLFLNGDVIFTQAIADLVANNLGDHSWTAVQFGAVGEEEVKFNVGSDGWVRKIGKTLSDGQGESVGITYLSANDEAGFLDALRMTSPTEYFESALQTAIDAGLMTLGILDLGDEPCIEIDFPDDLDQARSIFGTAP